MEIDHFHLPKWVMVNGNTFGIDKTQRFYCIERNKLLMSLSFLEFSQHLGYSLAHLLDLSLVYREHLLDLRYEFRIYLELFITR